MESEVGGGMTNPTQEINISSRVHSLFLVEQGKHDRGLKKAKQFIFFATDPLKVILLGILIGRGGSFFFFFPYHISAVSVHPRTQTTNPTSVIWRVHWHKTSALFQMLDEVGWVGFTLATS